MILTIMKQTTLFIILLAALLLTACSQKEKTYRIAVSQCSVGNWRFKLNDELLAAQYLYDQNVKVEIINCYDRSDVQVRQIDSLSQSDIDLLVVAPNEYEEVAPALRRAKERGVPVILFDRKVDTDDYTAFIGGDNVAVGRMAAEYAMLLVAQSAGKHISEVTALQSTSPSLDRHRGFEEVMRSHPQMDYQCIFSDWDDHHTHDIVKEQLGQDRVILGLSGGVDSSVAAVLLNRAIGNRLTCIFVDHGMLRKNEFTQVMDDYRCLGLNVIGVDASEKFFGDLAGVTDPEQKRKIIGRDFVEVFNAEAKKITDAKWLAQGTIYPDRIESLNITGKVIKSHHNVGGLPKEMHLQLCEPLKWLFKDEVRRVGRQLGMPEHLITRHPFPGPGLAVRILGDITPEKVRILQDADDIYIRGLREYVDADGETLYNKVWQAGAILLSTVRSVGVMGDERTYEHPVALRAVTSTDAMTADWAHLPYDFMAKVSNEIINKVRGVNRVCYDISSKPPATIEWE